MKNITLLLLSLLPLSLLSQELKIEPLYSFEKSYRIEPAPAKYVTRTYLGIRATYGVPLLSGELEVAQSTGTDNFPTTNSKVDYTTQRAMLGIKSYPFKTKYIGAFFRSGLRAKKEDREITTSGVTTNTEGEIIIDPYAGAGLTVGISSIFALNAGATLVYNRNAPEGKKFDQQLNFSFTIKASNK